MATNNKVSVSEVKKAATTAATTVKKATEELKKDATAVKATATKTATKTAAAAKKTVSKTASSAKKKAAVKTAVVQYQDMEFSYDECMKKAEAGFKKSYKGKTIEEINIYIKPEERRIYYVVNKDCVGSVEL